MWDKYLKKNRETNHEQQYHSATYSEKITEIFPSGSNHAKALYEKE